MPVVQTQTPIWSIWAAAMDNAFQLQAFVLSTGNKCAPSAGAGLTVNVAAGTVVVNGNTTTTAISAGSVTPTSPVNNPRRDIVFISSAGSITLTQGTEAPAPVPPALPAGACLIAVLFIPTGAADYSAGFPNAGIEDMRFIFAYDISTGVPSFHSLGTAAAQAAAGNHTTPAMTATVAGHVPTPPNNTTTFLRGDGTFATPPSATATVAGYVPTPPNDAAKFLDGTGAFSVPSGIGYRYNYLTNPGFEIDQRGGSVTASAAYAHDRWQLTLAGTDTATITDEATIVDTTSSHALKAVVVVGTGAGASNVGQVLKNADLGAYSLKGQTIDFAIRVRTATASACKAAIMTDGTGGTTTLSAFHTGGGTFETLSVSVAVPTDATTLTIKVTFAVSCTAYLDNAILVIGSSAQTYYPLTPAEEWERCQRYYEVHGGGGVDFPVVRQYAGANGNVLGSHVSYTTRKVVAATVTKNGTWAASNCGQCSIGADGSTVHGYELQITASGAGVCVSRPGDATTFITAEANS